MLIDIATGDLQTLRHELWHRLTSLNESGAAKSGDPQFLATIDPTRVVLRKAIRKLNAALKKVHGHNCLGEYFV